MFNDNEATPDQWRAIRSRRGKTALAAKALWDVVLGQEPDGRTDGGDYIKFYRIAQTALRHFRHGTPATYAERRPKTYKLYEAILSALAEIALKTVTSAYAARSREQVVEPGATLEKTPKKTELVTMARARGPQCDLCGEYIKVGNLCAPCKERLDEIANLLADRGPRTVREIIRDLQFEEEESVLFDLQADARFRKKKSGRWSVAPGLRMSKRATPSADETAEHELEAAEAFEPSDDPDESYFAWVDFKEP